VHASLPFPGCGTACRAKRLAPVGTQLGSMSLHNLILLQPLSRTKGRQRYICLAPRVWNGCPPLKRWDVPPFVTDNTTRGTQEEARKNYAFNPTLSRRSSELKTLTGTAVSGKQVHWLRLSHRLNATQGSGFLSQARVVTGRNHAFRRSRSPIQTNNRPLKPENLFNIAQLLSEQSGSDDSHLATVRCLRS
jgi:hypothetical protein